MSNIIAVNKTTKKEIICEYNVANADIPRQLQYWKEMGMSFCNYIAKSTRTFTKKGI